MAALREIARSFRAMNTGVEAIVCAPEERQDEAARALEEVERLFQTVEETLSRFRPGSELSRLNFCGGQPFQASPLLFEVVSQSLEAARLSEGIFDPSVLPALIAAGYDRSFEKLENQPPATLSTSEAVHPDWRKIELRPDTREIVLPPGVQLDLGGIGKGWTVDRACSYLTSFPGFAVDAGGDIRVKGLQADGSPWTVGVENPFENERDLTILELREGAVCTSSTGRRSWTRGGQRRHHLIDPRTGAPAESGIASVTILGESAVKAEVAAKVVLILGPRPGLEMIEKDPGLKGLIVLDSEQVICSPGIRRTADVA